ncbi:Probable ATP-dependent RNA helicase DHX34 [Camponotus floridanus]|uniref:Probable ATP-dependent RNA helicase DHX34 n=1 Tax=Camponotus floridanus TaxID=104421 RepID=E2A8T0_CAMFO|nr:Probable ATP-dependent RNA helicase DHX34 [Camponotus floridanus]
MSAACQEPIEKRVNPRPRRVVERSLSRTDRETRKSSSSTSRREESDQDFYFSNYKHELNKIFTANSNLIHDVVDFWKFVEKYESVKKQLGDSEESAADSSLNSIGVPEKYHKSHCLNFKLNLSYGELFARVPEVKQLTKSRLLKFRDVIVLYLDFKQKEKLSKLRKLRDTQANLPVARYKDEIIETVKKEKVIIIAGDTGCGKSTQVPRYLYEAGFRKIACTQPRRIACISLAKRVAFETLSENLSRVGYQIRFEKQKNQETNITFITEGLLLRQMSGELALSSYDVIVLDEVHERHLHGDFLLGIMKCIIYQKPDLKLVLMSATINIELFNNYFAKEDVKIIEVRIFATYKIVKQFSGRTGPGVCYRIYSEEDYKILEKYSTPELQRVPLDSSLLQMIAMGLPDARKFPFIEPPPANSLENAILSLKDHSALTDNEKITCIGKTLARLPVDITIGKMLIMGSIFHQVEPVLSLAAALSIQTPFTNRAYRDAECETSRKRLESDHGDPITLLNAFKEWLEVKQENSQEYRGGSNSSRKWCRRRGLEEQRFYEMIKLRTQFKELLQDCKLLKSLPEPNSSMTSAERAIRHGELKLLKSLKRTYKQSESRKRKQLKVETFDIQLEDNDDENGELDIKDIEFRMKNDSSQVQNLLTASTACSYKDLTMLKLILCSGLYPQFACADEYNYCKSMSEQLFHTKAKPYVALHPMSFFGNHQQLLQIEEADIISIPGFKSKSPVSSKHQILAYLSLLETTKPYLVNTLRMPAAQTLLLFAREIDTNNIFSLIACDSWLMLEFPVPDSGQTLLMRATKLRNKWDFLLNQQLQGSDDANNEMKDFSKIEQNLTQELIEYMHTTVPYTIKRLLPADLKMIYVGNGNNDTCIEPNPFQADFKSVANITKGGVHITDNITYNCLKETDWSEHLITEMRETEWHCQNCDFQAILSNIEKLQHQNCCIIANAANIEKESENIMRKPNSQAYECSDCSQILYLTPIEILKHKKLHIKTN